MTLVDRIIEKLKEEEDRVFVEGYHMLSGKDPYSFANGLWRARMIIKEVIEEEAGVIHLR